MALSAVIDVDITGNPLVTLTISGVTGARITVSRQWFGQRAPVRGGQLALVLGSVMIAQDWEAPFGIPVTYTVECYSGAGVLLESWLSGPITIPVTVPWISDPIAPRSACAVSLDGDSMRSMEYGRDGKVVGILGSSQPIAVVGTRNEASGFSLGFQVDTDNERETVLSILKSADPVLVRLPPAWVLLPPLAYVTADSVTEEDVTRFAGGTKSTLWIDGTLVSPQTANVIVPPRTYADLAAEASTYADMSALYPTYADAQKG